MNEDANQDPPPSTALDRVVHGAAHPSAQLVMKLVLGGRGKDLAEFASNMDERRRARRTARAEKVVADAAEEVGAGAFLERATGDEAFEDLVYRAAEVASAARGEDKRRALRRALVVGARDRARVDEQRMIVETVAGLEPPHIHVLDVLSELVEIRRAPFESRRAPVALSPHELSERFSGMAHVLEVVLHQLENAALIQDTAAGTWDGTEGKRRWSASPYGRMVLQYLGEEEPDLYSQGGPTEQPAGSLTSMTEETRLALRNYDWLVRSRGLDDVGLDWETDTLVYGEGGAAIDTLCEAGFTSATEPAP